MRRSAPKRVHVAAQAMALQQQMAGLFFGFEVLASLNHFLCVTSVSLR
jgi:hypothetical protein